MARILPKTPQSRLTFFLILGTLILGGGAVFAIKVVKPFARSWLENRNIQVAREQFAQNDPASALLAIRQVLGKNPNNIEALKLAIQITEKQNSPEILNFQNRLTQAQPGLLANRIKLLELSIKYGSPTLALDAIEKAGPEAAESPEFHKLAAKVLLALRENTKAKYHLISLIKFRPEDAEARLDLAQLRLNEGFADNKPTIRAEIRSLASNPDLRIRAYSLLLRDALASQDTANALELADQLQLSTGLQPIHELLVLETYRLHAPIKFTAYANALKLRYANDATKVISLSNLLLNNGHTQDIKTWLESLDEKVRAVEGVQISYAFALLNLKQIPQLEAHIRTSKWEKNEYVRQALLAYARKTSGDEKGFSEAWKLALIDAGDQTNKIDLLISQILAWGWEEQKFELLWKRFQLNPRDPATRQQLLGHELAKGNTPALNRIFARIVENDPSDNENKNFHAYSSLLLGQNAERAHQAAEEVYKADPKNPFFITTYALSLSLRGKPEQALEIINTLDYAAKQDYTRLVLRSHILALNKNYQEAANALRNVTPRKILPEEQRILQQTQQLIAQNLREKDQALAIATYQQENTGTRTGWFTLLPAEFRNTSDLKQQLADKLYSEKDFKALETSLRTEKWENHDFLRLGLLAYAQRQLEKETESRSNWRFATTLARNNPEGLNVLQKLATAWSWTPERLEVLNRLFQNDPLNQEIFTELVQHHTTQKSATELARLYQTRIEARGTDATEKARFAYYSLLTGSNTARAHVHAKEAYEANPTDAFIATTYAFSLGKQNRAADALKALEKFPDAASTGFAQMSLHKALLYAATPGDNARIQSLLLFFDPKSALPEEAQLAETLAQQNAAR